MFICFANPKDTSLVVKQPPIGVGTTQRGIHKAKRYTAFVENVRTDAIQEVLRDLKSLIRMHLRYTGDNNGWMFPLKPNGFATTKLCEPWCAVKGFCPKYGRVLMPHDMKKEMKA